MEEPLNNSGIYLQAIQRQEIYNYYQEANQDLEVPSPRRRKITPPPWSKVLHISPPLRTSPNSHLNINTANPFRREVFKSLLERRQTILNNVGDQNNRLEKLLNIVSKFESKSSKKFHHSLQNITAPCEDWEIRKPRITNRKSSDDSSIEYTSFLSLSKEDIIKDWPEENNEHSSPVTRTLEDPKEPIPPSLPIESLQEKDSYNCDSNIYQSEIIDLNENITGWTRNANEITVQVLDTQKIQSNKGWKYSFRKALLPDRNKFTDVQPNGEFQASFHKSKIADCFQVEHGAQTSALLRSETNCDLSNLQSLCSEIAPNFLCPNPSLKKPFLKVMDNADRHGESLFSIKDDSKEDKRSNFGEMEKSVLSSSVYFDLGVHSEELFSPGNDSVEETSKVHRNAHLISGCDSGIEVDFEDDLRSMSRGSLFALSDEDEVSSLHNFSEDDEVLCGNRVSQMTRTYHDIDAVTRLLQEKEKDLELAARIGQQLLERNKSLQEKNSALEAEVSASSDKITQLRHDLLMKTDLLQIYTNDTDESSADTSPSGPRHISVDLLQRRVRNLEHENVYLREEASQLACDTQSCEEKEKELVHDVIKQLNEANIQVHQLSEELSRKIEDSLRQQEDTTQLLAQIVDVQASNKRLTRENEELASLVGVARECQQELTTELAELKEKYAEVLDLLHDTQEQLRRVQKKNFPGSRGSHLSGHFSSSFHSGSDSIASELHSLSSFGEEAEKVDGTKSFNRVFDTVRLSSKLGNSMPPLGYSGGSVYSTPTKQASQVHSHLSTPLHMGGRYSPYFGSGISSHMSGSSGLASLDSGADSDGSFPTDSEDNYPASRTGVPGWPGTPDLDSCIRRLGSGERGGSMASFLPYGCRTPDSIMSTGSGRSGLSGYSGSDWKYPQKLQIVKPIEGSLTLHQWSRLATPHLGGLLEDREGVANKGATNADINLEVYSMSDLEEDDEDKEFPGKRFMSTSGIYTFTNSTVLHPDDVTSLTPSLSQTKTSVLPTSSISSTIHPSIPSTPAPSQPASRRGSTATFSINVALAKHLHERGFGSGISNNMMPTATPANSPDGSRPGSPEPFSYKLPGLDDLTKHFHAGASFIRRTLYGGDPSVTCSSSEGQRINLVEKVQALGVDRFVGPTGRDSQSVGGVVTSRPYTASPLLHLSNLIMSGAKRNSPESTSTSDSAGISERGIMSTPRITSPGERRPQIPLGAPMGIPGHPGSGHLESRLTQLKPGQRSDLGTVGTMGSRPRPLNLGTVPGRNNDEKMGTIGWTSLSRKGGLL